VKTSVARWSLAVTAAAVLTACAVAPSVPPETRSELAPPGRVRAAINYGNPVLARKDPATGELRGVTVDLARELERRAGVPVELIGYDTVATMLAALRAREWDVGFLAVDPARADEVTFTAPYMEVEVTYLVAHGSDMRAAADVDRAGVRISVQERNAADLFLTRNLKAATVVRTPNLRAAFEALRAGNVEAFAANRQELSSVMASNPGYRAVEGRFSTIPHAAAVPAGKAAAATWLRGFIEQAKASGFVRQAIDRSGVQGVVVAPAAQ
jgi:polar amino acid transport system substrate-binding protein